jgi:hypothetical protein
MRKLAWSAVVMATAIGCAGNEDESTVSVPGTDGTEVQISGTGGVMTGATQAPPPACAMPSAPGVLARTQLTSEPDGAGLVMNANGEVAFLSSVQTGVNAEGKPVYTPGVAKLDAALNKMFDYPHGTAVALDAQGNVYVAGGFTVPTDFGTGVIAPTGNIDTFLVKLSPTGEVTSAMHLGMLCGDGVTDIAVSADGRVAISGSAMGTVVLDVTGDVVFQTPASGQVAFDGAGNLAVGGAFTGQLDLGGGTVLVAGGPTDVDAFLAKLDADGDVVFSQAFGDATLPIRVLGFDQDQEVTEPRPQKILDLAVNANGAIAVVGTYDMEMSLLGQTLKNGSYFPSGSQLGTFYAAFDAAGNATFGSRRSSINEYVGMPSIALGPDGLVAISSNDPGNSQGPWAYPNLGVRDAAGVERGLFGDTGPAGYGLGVAIDACGHLLWASYANQPNIFDRHSFLTRVAL